MQYNKVEICGINTGRLKVLKEKEKMELLKKAQAGDKNARNELVEGNLRLVLSVVFFKQRGKYGRPFSSRRNRPYKGYR